ncbi:MAG: alpha/beta fold hydrolase [Gammaproteobacteria bacterium]|nr:alpha/beta fold hydrolase [Gammaproteobacteria bacterium]
MRFLLAVLLAGCTGAPRPDLKQLYAMTDASAGRQPPVVLIHGVFGARLVDPKTDEEAWPGGLNRLLFHDYRDLALAIDPATLKPRPSPLTVAGITDTVAGRDYYGEILRTLESAAHYRPAHPGEAASGNERRYYVFTYDWRQDNVESARRLDALIEQIRHDYGDPALKVDLIAHSMGGLIARYYLRYGTEDVLDGDDFPINGRGAQRVRKIILLGTPSLGSVSALQHAITGFPVGLGRMPPEVLATFPSAFQLLPHPLNDWLLTGDGQPLDRDLFDVEVWRRFEWSIFAPEARERVIAGYADRAQGQQALVTLERNFQRNLERARRFVWSLTVRETKALVPLIVFGGDCTPTPARVVVEEEHGDSVLRLFPNEVRHPKTSVDYTRLMLEPGDGSVTKASLLARTHLDPSRPRHAYSYFPLDYTVLLCEAHDQLTGNINFQDNLLHALLSMD